MPIYEFRCPKGHVIENIVKTGTRTIPCTACMLLAKSHDDLTLATRILSPTRTTFEFADSRRKRSIE